MSNFDHWMRLNIGDFLADTMHLSTLQNGIYLRLIFHYFKRKNLPNDAATLAQIAQLSLYAWKRHSGPVLALFRYENGVYRHKRIDAELLEAERLSSRARAKRGVSLAGARESDDFLAGAPVTTTTATSEGGIPLRPPRKDSPSNSPAGGGASVVSIPLKKGNGHDGA